MFNRFLKACCLRAALASSLLFTARVGVKKLEDLHAYQLAIELRAQVYRVFDSSVAARRDDQFRSQLFNSAGSVAANVAEGWSRFSAPEFCQFLRYARASVEETKVWLDDGVARGYFDAASITATLRLADRTSATITALWRSLQPFKKR